MDVVYILGNGSQWYNYEIKYSVRSIAKHCASPNVFIVGEKPDFFDYNKITHFPFKDIHHTQRNIWEKVYYACTQKEINEDFLFINDDHFILSDFSGYPYYYDGNLNKQDWFRCMHSNPYYTIVSRTYQLLNALNMPTLFYDIHTPMMINKQKFITCYNYFKNYLESFPGLVMKSTYCNFHNVEGVPLNDLKIKSRLDYKSLKKEIQNRIAFSISDRCCSQALLNLLNELYPEKYGIFEIE